MLERWIRKKLAKGQNDAASAEKPTVQASESKLEIPTVSEEMYAKIREALAKEGYTFVVNILPSSVGQLATDSLTSQRFGYVNSSENMRAIVPLQMEVAINPKRFRIPKSNSKSTDVQIGMLAEEERALQAKLPQEVRNLIRIPIQSTSVLAQLDDKYEKETGKLLFTSWFGRTDDQTVPGGVAGVGRLGPADGLRVVVWFRGRGYGSVFVVPVVVLPRKLVV